MAFPIEVASAGPAITGICMAFAKLVQQTVLRTPSKNMKFVHFLPGNFYYEVQEVSVFHYKAFIDYTQYFLMGLRYSLA